MPQAKLKNVTLNYELSGPEAAPVLAFSNSLGTNYGMWDRQLPEFKKQFRVLRYDTRGHGKSSVPDGLYTLTQLANDFIQLLDDLRIEQVDFCGLSLGGMTGIWLGIHAPKRVKRLVLCNTAAKIGTTDTWNSRIEAVRKGGMEAIIPNILERWFTHEFRAKEPKVVLQTGDVLLNTPAQGYIGCCAAVRDMDQRSEVASISAPTLVITGSKDPVTPPADGQSLVSAIRKAQYAEFDTAHLSNIEAANAFTVKVSQFLAT